MAVDYIFLATVQRGKPFYLLIYLLYLDAEGEVFEIYGCFLY